MPRPPEFSEEDKIKMLLWCGRRCCLCGKNAGPDIEIAHIDRKGGNGIENGIPLCYDCHAKIGHYNREHPRGNKYKPIELKALREQIYEEQTRSLVPPVHFIVTNTRADGSQHNIPFVGFHFQHLGDSLPIQLKVEAKIILNGTDLGIVPDTSGYYTGNALWNINPRILFWGGFNIDPKFFNAQDFKIEVRVTIIDQFNREHRLLPQCWRWVPRHEETPAIWNLEPRSFTTWD